MIFFKNKDLYKVIKKKVDSYGQIITTYVKDETLDRVCVQPIENSVKEKIYGEKIESNKEFYSNVLYEEDDLVTIDNKIYSIEKVIEWNTYNRYAIKLSDIKLTVGE